MSTLQLNHFFLSTVIRERSWKQLICIHVPKLWIIITSLSLCVCVWGRVRVCVWVCAELCQGFSSGGGSFISWVSTADVNLCVSDASEWKLISLLHTHTHTHTEMDLSRLCFCWIMCPSDCDSRSLCCFGENSSKGQLDSDILSDIEVKVRKWLFSYYTEEFVCHSDRSSLSFRPKIQTLNCDSSTLSSTMPHQCAPSHLTYSSTSNVSV